jgi:hypothetical protein
MNFTPNDEATLPVLVGVASARIALAAVLGSAFEFFNSGSANVFIRFGDSTVAATTGSASATAPTAGSYVIGPGIVILVQRPPSATHMAHISGTAAQTLYLTPGNGE